MENADLWTGLGGVIVALAGGVWAAIRRKRKRAAVGKAAPAFAPRARFRAYLSLRTHESEPPPDVEIIEPPTVNRRPLGPLFPELEPPSDDETRPTNPPRRKP